MTGNKENSSQNSFPEEILPDLDSDFDPYDIPELTDEMIARGVWHHNGVPVKRGRPPAEHPKQAVTMRLNADVLAYYRATGPGWQGRVNGLLRKAAKLKAKA
ncbi:MAG: BrnA antitoxin family protein [Beijerinckiaceae bacterium]|jgi:uncharacterized protein (DUF4415 family)